MANTNTQQQTFKTGDMLYLPQQNQNGKIIGMTRTPYPNTVYKVEIIKSFNKDTQERLTQLLEVKCTDVEPYRKPKRKPTHKKYNPNEMTHMVREFHQAFNHPISESPKPLEKERNLSRINWIAEELVENLAASADNINEFKASVDDLIDAISRAETKSINNEDVAPKSEIERIVAQSDALVDALYFIHGSFTEMGVLPFNLFKIVQSANMGKLHNINGEMKPVYRESDGKIVKPEGWEENFAPESRLRKEILRQIEIASKSEQ